MDGVLMRLLCLSLRDGGGIRLFIFGRAFMWLRIAWVYDFMILYINYLWTLSY